MKMPNFLIRIGDHRPHPDIISLAVSECEASVSAIVFVSLKAW